MQKELLQVRTLVSVLLRHPVRTAWVVACACVLGLALVLLGREGQSDADVLFAYAMVILGFPSSLLVVGFSAAALALLQAGGRVIQTSPALLVATWVGFVLVGYIQWFIVVPSLVSLGRRLVARRTVATADNAKRAAPEGDVNR